jgi:hypothetical protein
MGGGGGASLPLGGGEIVGWTGMTSKSRQQTVSIRLIPTHHTKRKYRTWVTAKIRQNRLGCDFVGEYTNKKYVHK